MCKVQRLSLTGVHHKLMVMEAVSTIFRDDIVQPNKKLLEVHKRTGIGLRPILNISVVFGMSANTFIPYAFTNYNMRYTKDEADEVRASYFRKYPDVGKHHKWVWDNYKKPSFIVETALGRRVKPKLGTDGINTPVQGSGAETTKLAIHYLVKDYGEEVLQYIYNTVHDAIYLRVPKGTTKKWGEALEKSMLKAWDEIGKTDLFHYKDIPMIAEVEIYK